MRLGSRKEVPAGDRGEGAEDIGIQTSERVKFEHDAKVHKLEEDNKVLKSQVERSVAFLFFLLVVTGVSIYINLLSLM